MNESTTLNVSLTAPLRAFVDQQVAAGGYRTASEYIRELVRQARKHAADQRLEALLLEGLESGEAEQVTDESWAQMRAELIERSIAAKRERKRDRAGLSLSGCRPSGFFTGHATSKQS